MVLFIFGGAGAGAGGAQARTHTQKKSLPNFERKTCFTRTLFLPISGGISCLYLGWLLEHTKIISKKLFFYFSTGIVKQTNLKAYGKGSFRKSFFREAVFVRNPRGNVLTFRMAAGFINALTKMTQSPWNDAPGPG